MRKQVIAEKGAPPQGVYSPAIIGSGTAVYISGQGPIDQDGQLVSNAFAEQARKVFDNITVLLEAAGASWASVLRTGVFLADLADFQEMNEIYREYLTEPFPARTTVQAGLLHGMLIEVDCVALVDEEA